MRVLTQKELNQVSGGNLEGALAGMTNGLTTGMAIGNIQGNAGHSGVGSIANLPDLLMPTIIGGVVGLVYGAMTDKNQVDALLTVTKLAHGLYK